MAMNQQLTFLSDGRDEVRQVPPYWNPEAEYGLDWFDITMRITVMKPMAKGLADEGKARVETGSQPAEPLAEKSIAKELQSLKGNLFGSMRRCSSSKARRE
jgi:hypothetical protein